MAARGQPLLLKSGCCGPPLHRFRPAALLALAWLLAGPTLAAPSLTTDSPLATAGYYQLSWSGAPDSAYELQESPRADFASTITLYRGPDRASMLTGRADGDYFYRLRALDGPQAGPWSTTLRVEVRHHPLSRALLFLTLGALVFLATLAAILVGNRQAGGET